MVSTQQPTTWHYIRIIIIGGGEGEFQLITPCFLLLWSVGKAVAVKSLRCALPSSAHKIHVNKSKVSGVLLQNFLRLWLWREREIPFVELQASFFVFDSPAPITFSLRGGRWEKTLGFLLWYDWSGNLAYFLKQWNKTFHRLHMNEPKVKWIQNPENPFRDSIKLYHGLNFRENILLFRSLYIRQSSIYFRRTEAHILLLASPSTPIFFVYIGQRNYGNNTFTYIW